jgi:Cdc6-like AAA superfamily ATPase
LSAIAKREVLMQVYRTGTVFGVSNEPVATYIVRETVDNVFKDGLTRNKHIIVYGASKQGKTSLTNQHLKPGEFVRVNCSDRSQPIDLYKSVLRQLSVEIVEERQEEVKIGGEVKVTLKAKIKIPF